MGLSIMLDSYRKLQDKAACTVNSPAGDLGHPDRAAEWIWQRLLSKKHARGYSLPLVKQIITEQAKVPEGKAIPLPPELRARLSKLGRVSRKEG